MTGTDLQKLREALGLNQAQVAEYLGVDRATVLRWERAEILPNMAELAAHSLVPGTQIDRFIKKLKPAARRGVHRRLEMVKKNENLKEDYDGRRTDAGGFCGVPATSISSGPAEEKTVDVDGVEKLGEIENITTVNSPDPGSEELVPALDGISSDNREVEHEPIAAGPEVEKVRRALKVRFFQYGPRGVRDLEERTGIKAERLEPFSEGRVELLESEYRSIVVIIRESESL